MPHASPKQDLAWGKAVIWKKHLRGEINHVE